MDHHEIHAPNRNNGGLKMSKAKAVAPGEPEARTIAITPMQMLQIAVERNADLDKLQQLMDLNDRWESNEAKKAFVVALNEFKKDPPAIIKNKHVSFAGRGGGAEYDHATLDHVSGEIGKALSEHGLSHRWEVEQGKDVADVRITVTCILTHQKGHSEKVSMWALPDDSGAKNRIQAIGSTVTYLQRYTLLAATGLAAADQDDDGEAAAERPWKGPLGKTELKTAARTLATVIQSAGTLDDLKAVQIDNMEVIEQMQDDLPEWYFGDGADIKGAKTMIAERRAALEKQQGARR